MLSPCSVAVWRCFYVKVVTLECEVHIIHTAEKVLLPSSVEVVENVCDYWMGTCDLLKALQL